MKKVISLIVICLFCIPYVAEGKEKIDYKVENGICVVTQTPEIVTRTLTKSEVLKIRVRNQEDIERLEIELARLLAQKELLKTMSEQMDAEPVE